jgi:hypothetical protein
MDGLARPYGGMELLYDGLGGATAYHTKALVITSQKK